MLFILWFSLIFHCLKVSFVPFLGDRFMVPDFIDGSYHLDNYMQIIAVDALVMQGFKYWLSEMGIFFFLDNESQKLSMF